MASFTEGQGMFGGGGAGGRGAGGGSDTTDVSVSFTGNGGAETGAVGSGFTDVTNPKVDRGGLGEA
jgi:hypothetical protein